MTAQYIKKNKRVYLSKIKKQIISALEKQSLSRKMLINNVLDHIGLTAQQRADNSVDGICVLLRSYIGEVISEGVGAGEITEDNGGLSLKLNIIYLSNAEVKEHIKGILKENRPFTKQEVFDECIAHFGADKTFSDADNNIIRAFAGEFLARCERSGILTNENGKYRLTPEDETRLASYETFISSINSNGGEYFERYGAMLIRRFYEKSGFIVTECDVTGGSDDGGIDIIVRTEDMLGFKDFIAVQAKARRNSHVTVKEVREFIGAMHTIGANRGIYLTTSYFHEDAEQLIAQAPNVTKIDGNLLWKLARECKLFKV